MAAHREAAEHRHDRVEFLDSSGIGALLSVYKRLEPRRGERQLLNVKPAVQSVFELMRMHRIFDIQSHDSAAKP